MKNPFLHRLMKDDKKDVIHSSAYARAQSGGGMGVDSVESFAARRAVDAKREAVRRYNESKIVGEAGVRAIRTGSIKTDNNTEVESGRNFGRVSASDKDREGAVGARSAEGAVGIKGAKKTTGERRFVEPSSNRSSAGPPARRNPGISR